MVDPLPDDSPLLQINDRYLPSTDPEFVARVVAAALNYVQRPEMPVSLLLTDEAEIGRIHQEFLGDPAATDVISFPLDDGVDLVVSVERASRQSQQRGHSLAAELALYITHGILHACGFDDIDAEDRVAMRTAERAVLDALGFRIDAVDSN